MSWLANWFSGSNEYGYDGNGDSGNVFGWLEEELNYVNRVYPALSQRDGFLHDLLMPMKERK